MLCVSVRDLLPRVSHHIPSLDDAGEVVEGATAVKMLTWEASFEKLLQRIRGTEAAPMWRMLMIEATSMAVMYFCTPVASFVTFAVHVATGGVLNLASVFYVVGLLHLPKLWLALFFVKGVKSSSEALVASRRINDFLCQLEARTPGAAPVACDCPTGRTVFFSDKLLQTSITRGPYTLPAAADAAQAKRGTVEMCGADFCWRSRAWAGPAAAASGEAPAAPAAAAAAAPRAAGSSCSVSGSFGGASAAPLARRVPHERGVHASDVSRSAGTAKKTKTGFWTHACTCTSSPAGTHTHTWRPATPRPEGICTQTRLCEYT